MFSSSSSSFVLEIKRRLEEMFSWSHGALEKSVIDYLKGKGYDLECKIRGGDIKIDILAAKGKKVWLLECYTGSTLPIDVIAKCRRARDSIKHTFEDYEVNCAVVSSARIPETVSQLANEKNVYLKHCSVSGRGWRKHPVQLDLDFIE